MAPHGPQQNCKWMKVLAFGLFLTVIFEMSSSFLWLGPWRWHTPSCLCPPNSLCPTSNITTLTPARGSQLQLWVDLHTHWELSTIFFGKGKEICDELLNLGFFLTPWNHTQRQYQVENMVIAKKYHSSFYWGKTNKKQKQKEKQQKNVSSLCLLDHVIFLFFPCDFHSSEKWAVRGSDGQGVGGQIYILEI